MRKLNSIFTISFGGWRGYFPMSFLRDIFRGGYFPWAVFSGGVINIQTRPAFERFSEP